MTVPLMERADAGNHALNGTCVSGRSRELLLEIRNLLNVFAPDGDDYRHSLWIEVPRGKPSDWCSFSETKRWSEAGVYTRKDYLKEWKDNYPMESQWYHLSVSRYRGHTFLHMVENDHWWCQIHDDDDKHAHQEDMEWLLEPLAEFLREKVPAIAADVDAYNRYVDGHLPKRQRTGRIARKDLDRIVPWQRHRPRNAKKVIQMLKECIANEAVYRRSETRCADGEKEKPDVPAQDVSLPACYREPLPHMSIRVYAKYFRVAYEAYQDHFRHLYRRSRRERKAYDRWSEEASALSDVEFYRRYQHGRHGAITDETDLDSTQAFKEMAFDHYGELGLSRNDVHATDHYTPGHWLITFGVSYSAWVDAGCEIALALYEAGAPLLVHNAQKMLDILEGRDYVKLTPHTFHDYLNHHEEGSVFSLPHECYLGNGDEITREQYDEIVSLASWNPEGQLVLDKPVPLEDPVFGPIREEVSEPLTVCGILDRMEGKYGIGVLISEDDAHWLCCLYGRKDRPDIRIDDRVFGSVNEAVLFVLREFAKGYDGQSRTVSAAEGLKDEEQYIELVGKLKHLALTLPSDPSEYEVGRFLELDALADRYERDQDLAMGKTEMPLDVDVRLWFDVARKARGKGMATNDFVTEVLCRALGIERKKKVYTVSLLETQEGLALPVPKKVIDDMRWNDGDRMAVDCRGEGFVIWKMGEHDEEKEG